MDSKIKVGDLIESRSSMKINRAKVGIVLQVSALANKSAFELEVLWGDRVSLVDPRVVVKL